MSDEQPALSETALALAIAVEIVVATVIEKHPELSAEFIASFSEARDMLRGNSRPIGAAILDHVRQGVQDAINLREQT